jgi:DNA-binding transcriptional MerR regulator
MASLSTVAVAKKLGVVRATLQYWIKTGKIDAPKTQLRNGVAVRLWEAPDIARAKALIGTLSPGPKPKKKKKEKASKV